jgi:hypothetical protein
LIGTNYTPADALREAHYGAGRVWTAESITTIQVLLVCCWAATFAAAAMFISAFFMSLQQGLESPLAPVDGKIHLVHGP